MNDWRKEKALAVKILGGISKWLHVGTIPMFFSLVYHN